MKFSGVPFVIAYVVKRFVCHICFVPSGCIDGIFFDHVLRFCQMNTSRIAILSLMNILYIHNNIVASAFQMWRKSLGKVILDYDLFVCALVVQWIGHSPAKGEM